MSERSILIPSAVYDSVFRKLSRLASKAGISLEAVAGETPVYRLAAAKKATGEINPWTGERLYYKYHRLDTHQVVTCRRVTVGPMPAVNGYSFVGKIQHTEGGNILALAAHAREAEIPAAWRDAKPTCDHCNTVRPRKDTFLIRTPEGEIKRVGRNCLAEFTAVSPDVFVAIELFEDSLRELRTSDGEYECGGFWGHGEINTLHFLAAANSSVRYRGFWKRTNEAGRECTASHTDWLCRPEKLTRDNADKVQEHRDAQPTEDDWIEVIGMLIWLDEQDSSNSNYIHNMKVACGCAAAASDRQGLLASLPTAYARAMGKLAEKKARPEPAGYLGAPGERLEVEATVTFITTIDGHWGSKDVIGLRTVEGHECVTFYSGNEGPRTADVGKTFRVKGTVKKHEAYKGKPQTQFTRCKFSAAQ